LRARQKHAAGAAVLFLVGVYSCLIEPEQPGIYVEEEEPICHLVEALAKWDFKRFSVYNMLYM